MHEDMKRARIMVAWSDVEVALDKVRSAKPADLWERIEALEQARLKMRDTLHREVK